MELALYVVIAVFVLTVTLFAIRRYGIHPSTQSRADRLSRLETAALEKRYQAELRDGAPGSS